MRNVLGAYNWTQNFHYVLEQNVLFLVYVWSLDMRCMSIKGCTRPTRKQTLLSKEMGIKTGAVIASPSSRSHVHASTNRSA